MKCICTNKTNPKCKHIFCVAYKRIEPYINVKRTYKPKTQRGTDARQSAQKHNWRLFKIAGACANLKIICGELGLPSLSQQVLQLERRLRDETKSQHELSK